jgi:hypothetical protein
VANRNAPNHTLRWRKRINSPDPQSGDCRFEPGTEHALVPDLQREPKPRPAAAGAPRPHRLTARIPPLHGGGDGSAPSGAAGAELPSWEGTGLISRRCAGSSPASATDRGRVRPRHSLVAQRQSARLLTGKSGFESLLGSEHHEAVAQLVRAPGRQLGGRRFKSGQSRSRSHLKRGRPSAAAGPARSLSSAGRASARRAEGRWFEAISDHASAHRLTDRALAYEASGGGSSPPGRTRRSVAQRREQPVHTRQAAGSSPA